MAKTWYGPYPYAIHDLYNFEAGLWQFTLCECDGRRFQTYLVPPDNDDDPVLVSTSPPSGPCPRDLPSLKIETDVVGVGAAVPQDGPVLAVGENFQMFCAEDGDGKLLWTTTSPACLGAGVTDTWARLRTLGFPCSKSKLTTGQRMAVTSAVTRRDLRAVRYGDSSTLFQLKWVTSGSSIADGVPVQLTFVDPIASCSCDDGRWLGKTCKFFNGVNSSSLGYFGPSFPTVFVPLVVNASTNAWGTGPCACPCGVPARVRPRRRLLL